METGGLRWAVLAAVAVAVAVAVVAAGAMGAPRGQGDATTSSQPSLADSASGGRGVVVRGAAGVPALAGGEDGFAEAFAAYLGLAGGGAVAVTVVPDPDDGGGSAFYAYADGLWYECERVGGASGWAFALVGDESPVASRAAGEHSPGQGATGAGEADAASGAVGTESVRDGGQGAVPAVSVMDSGALAGLIGQRAAEQLPEAVRGYSGMVGVACDLGAVYVDASSVRAEGGGVGFRVSGGGVDFDVVYADDAFGFLVL